MEHRYDKNDLVSLSHRDAAQALDADRAGDFAPASPPAKRLRMQRWRDPRLWLGALLVVASVLLGASLFSAADDTVPIWAADVDVSAGMPLTEQDVRTVRVHFDDSESAQSYLSAAQPFPDGVIANQDVSAGELVATAAVDSITAGPDRLPVAVSSGGLPAGLAVGDRVDVWAVPAAETTGTSKQNARLVLDDVGVTSLGAEAAGGLDSHREVLVALPEHIDVGKVLDGLRGSDVVLVLVGE